MAERTKLTYSARLKFARYISLLVITTTVKPKQTSNVVNAYSVTNCLLPFFWRETRRFVLPWVCSGKCSDLLQVKPKRSSCLVCLALWIFFLTVDLTDIVT